MSCNCHGKDGLATKKTKPYDQCTACARKHVKNAWSKWGEFTYEEDNRDYVSAQLRDAADHLKYDHEKEAMLCRDLAMTIEENRDKNKKEIAERLDALRVLARELFYQDHPEAWQRLAELGNA